MPKSKDIPTPIGPEEILYKGEIIAVAHQKMQIGEKMKTFERARRSPGSRSIVISPDKKVLLTKEYRTEIKEWDYRLPGGKVCNTVEEYLAIAQDKDKLLEAAKKGAETELREEAGIEAKSVEFFAIAGSGGPTIEWDLYYFVVKDFVRLPRQNLDEGENIEVGWYTFPEAVDLCLSGKMREERSVGVLLRYFHTIGVI